MAGPISASAKSVPSNTERAVTRDDEYVRQRPREPHEIYEIDRRHQPRDMDLMWAAVKVRGAPNQERLNDFIRTGWRPALAADYPEHSGFDVKHSQSLIDMGFARDIKPDDPVINRDLMLMVRPKQMSRQSREEDKARADRQIDEHMNRLRQSSRRAIGDKTLVSREMTRHLDAPPDLVSEDSDVEMG